MKVLSSIQDNRINSLNVYVETTFGEYLSFASNIISNNGLQRKRVRTSKTVYSLLKTDLEQGCVIPPLVLAITNDYELEGDSEEERGSLLLDYIQTNPDSIIILDGLQRTYTLIDADLEMTTRDSAEYLQFKNHTLRLEVYLKINKFGILYRMLTLNTGQTPMSPRHQLEMLYSDMLGTEVEGLKLIPDTKRGADTRKNEFKFSNAIEGFNSYLKRDELPIDRLELLENIKVLEYMSKEQVENDLFKEFLESYIKLYNTLRTITDDKVLSEGDLIEAGISPSPFGKSVCDVFSTSQALTGYGAAIGRMKDRRITSIEKVVEIIQCLEETYKGNTDTEWLCEMLLRFDMIKTVSKKIGNAQRMFFQYFFRELLNKDGDSYLNLREAVEASYIKYDSQVN